MYGTRKAVGVGRWGVRHDLNPSVAKSDPVQPDRIGDPVQSSSTLTKIRLGFALLKRLLEGRRLLREWTGDELEVILWHCTRRNTVNIPLFRSYRFRTDYWGLAGKKKDPYLSTRSLVSDNGPLRPLQNVTFPHLHWCLLNPWPWVGVYRKLERFDDCTSLKQVPFFGTWTSIGDRTDPHLTRLRRLNIKKRTL